MGLPIFFKKIFNYAFEPRVALITFVIFLIATLILLDEEGAFVNNFFHFGPSTDEKNQAKFIGMKLDTWPKVIIVYLVAFLTSVLTAYYQNVISQFIHMYAWNPAIKTINYSKKWTYIITGLEPILYLLLNIITFFITLTTQFQFIFIRFLGSFIVSTPFDWIILGQKKFTKP
jgi:hypothetical protein